MPAITNFNQVIGRLAKEEAVAYTAETLSNSTDGCDIYIGEGDPPPPESVDFIYPGTTGRAWGTLAPQNNTVPNGQMRKGTHRIQPKGFGSAYSASVKPPIGIHRWLKMAGFDATYSATPTPQWTYTPTAHGAGYTTGTVRDYAQGSQYDAFGVIADLSWAAEGLAIPVFDFPWEGIASDPTDLALPTITIDVPSLLWPVAAGSALVLGAYTTANVRKVQYRRNRNMSTRRILMSMSGGYGGNVPGGAAPELEIEIERPARATWDPEAIAKAATVFATSYQCNTVQYNRWKHSFAQSQIKPGSVKPGNDGGIATVSFIVQARPSTPAANDYESILFN